MKKIIFLFCMVFLFDAVNAQFAFPFGSVDCSTTMTINDQQSNATFGLQYISGAPLNFEYDLGTEVQIAIDYRNGAGAGAVVSYKANNATYFITPNSTVQGTAPGYYYDYYLLKSVHGSQLLLEVYRTMSGTLIGVYVYCHGMKIDGLC